ncbi:MAG: bifunctional DNA primase/polymerase [Thermaerobacter sp.]|nr:bifunctional DNA primase/polymerase [Thermaerobacter sp.]
MTDENECVPIDEFLAFAAAGYTVIPLKPREKTPLQTGWTKAYAPSEKDVQLFFQKHPNCNMGMVLGETSGVVAIDIDGAGGEDILAQLCGGELPVTWESETPSGGRHLFFFLPAGATAKTKRYPVKGAKHEECALLGTGSQVVLPPSIHPNGGRYRWKEGRDAFETEMAEAPSWLLKLMGSTESPAPIPQVLNTLADRCPVFAKDLALQRASGIDETQWFLWCSLLEAAGHHDAAMAFSKLSTKHNDRSISRITTLATKGISAGTRCLTLGCTSEQITKCHGTIRGNDNGEVTNSPIVFLKAANNQLGEEVPEHSWPTEKIYEPFVQALKGTDYRLDAQGQLQYVRDERVQTIANFVARPIAEITKDDGVTTERYFVLESVLHGGRALPPITVPSAAFLSMRWTIEWGISQLLSASRGSQDHFRMATQLLAADVRCETIYGHLGWRQVNGKYVYLHAAGCIGADNVSVELDQTLSRYTLPERVSDLKTAARASLALLDIAPRGITIPLLATVYLSVLCEPLRLASVEPNFLVWIYGTTGTRKTSVGMLFLSHFGDFVRSSPPASFNDTANALEKKASVTKDSLIVVDDYHPASSPNEFKRLVEIAQKLLRSTGDRTGRGRLTASTAFRPAYITRGMCLVTGEDIISGHSSSARFLGLEVLRDSVDLPKLTTAQDNCELLAESMRAFIEWLVPKMPKIATDLKKSFLEYRAAFQDAAAHGRTGEAVSWLQVGFNTMLAFMSECGAISEQESESLRQEATSVFHQLVESQNNAVMAQTPSEKCMSAVYELLNTQGIAPSPVAPRAGKTLLYHKRDLIGWHDSTYYYFFPTLLYNAVEQHLNRKNSTIGLTARALWGQLDSMGVLVTEKAPGRTQRTTKQSIPGTNKRVRVLQIPIGHVKDLDCLD